MRIPNAEQWRPAPDRLTLPAGEVHLWRAHLEAPPSLYAATLSAGEWVRAERFHFDRDRDAFITGRGLLRTILSRYLGIAPSAIDLAQAPHGKPYLRNAEQLLRFNVSHSDGLLLVAVAHGREVGVDVEAIRSGIPFDELAVQYFEPDDAWHIRMLRDEAKARKFYEVWTGTEARLKASGAGLLNGTKILEPDRWSLLSLCPWDGFSAALAVDGQGYQLECWSWPN